MDEKAKHYENLINELNELGRQDLNAAAAKAKEIAIQARKSGDEGYALFFEGEAFCFEENYEKAEQLEKKAVKLLPNIYFILSNYGVVLAELDRNEEALEYFDKALAINPNSDHALSCKGVSLSELDRNEEALEYFDKALAINPNSDHALRNKGATLSELDRYEEALAHYEKAREIKPWDHVDLSFLINIYEELDKLDEAESTALELIEILKNRNEETNFARLKLERVKAKKKKSKTKETDLTDSMLKVIDIFGLDVLTKYVKQVDEKKEEFNNFIEITKDKSEKIKKAPEKGLLSVLRRWNSFTPIMTLDTQESKGGGYFLYMGGKGIVIDPGFDFVRNFFQEKFKLSDIDHIFITHAHVDHMADLEALFALLQKANDNKEDDEIKTVDLFLNIGSMKKLSSWLNLEEKYIGRIHVLEEGQVIRIGDVSVTATQAKHREVIDEKYSLGFVFEVPGYKVGFTGDTGWEIDGSIAQPFKGCQVLVAHLGSILQKEIEPDKEVEDRLYKNHLGILGMSGMIGDVKPDLCVISEFGEEIGRHRGKLADGLEKALGTKCLAADVGTEIQLSNPPKVRCACCGGFFEKWHRYREDPLILYTCEDCKNDEEFSTKLKRYCKGKRDELWDCG